MSSTMDKKRSRPILKANPPTEKKASREDEPAKKKARSKSGLIEVKGKIKETVAKSKFDVTREYPIVLSKNISELDGGSVKLETEFKGNSSTQVILYLNGEQYDGQANKNFHPEIIYSDEKKLYMVRIVIKEANTSNSGTYAVFLVNNRKRVIVDYNIKIDERFDKPWLTDQPECLQLSDGSLKLKFGVRVSREFTTKWTLNNKPVELNQQYSEAIEKLENDRYTINLDIKAPLSMENNGRYECEVTSSGFSLKSAFNVEIEDNKPILTKEPTIKLEISGNEPVLVLTVEYNSKQNASVLWNGRGGQLMNDHTIMTKPMNVSGNFVTQLRLTNCKSEHSGIYDCKIENESGSVVAELNAEIEDPSNGKENSKK